MCILIPGYRFLVLVGIASLILVIIIISITIGILKFIDKKKHDTAMRKQLLMEQNAAQALVREQQNIQQQHFQQPMYNSEMVPDILESSLPRHPAPQYAPSSDSSYGTNYPGTMYFMGQTNQASQVQDQSRHSYQDYDSVTLPKKPETVSDSESEDTYAVIPAYAD